YKEDDPSIQEVRVQYRRSLNTVNKIGKMPAEVLNNDWIDIEVIDGSVLTESFYITNWNTASLGDGTYEIRAVLSCSGDPIKTASQVVRGVIDRNAPRILGSVEPADGVFGPDDQILVQFNEPIDQNGINPLEDVLLIDTQTGKPIDREVSIFSNAISIVPLSEDRFLENKVLRAEINKLRDMRGNAISKPIRWDFLFDKSPVRWSNARVDITANLDQTVSFVRSFQNSGGSPISFDLTNLPSWISAFPMSGTLTPGTSVDIQFVVSNQLGAGSYSGSVEAITSLGSEPLSINVRLLCSGPEWELNPAQFQHSMNIIGELKINGIASTDEFDIIAAYVGTELRGLGMVSFVQGLDAYQVYMNIYSNQSSGEILTFRVWDASACLEYGSIEETFTFSANSLIGTPQQPVSLTTSQLIVQELSLNKGWTWFSVNTRNENMQTGNFLRDLSAKSGDIIRAQSQFSMFSSSSGWVGSLDSLRTGSMYQ
ncbi:MAG: Ig-like domain-containing protein, partial [Bacteroidetes bacterium]|nr:Ig-like domain-containing protein [Bacteroidota bacterium]